MNEFLKVEYEKCLDLIKFYDDKHQSLVKFAVGLSGAVPSLLLAVFKLSETTDYFWQFVTLISLTTTIGLLSIYTVMIQLRLYFVYPARQVNALRGYFLKKNARNFNENQMYLDTNFSAFKFTSSHSLLNAFVAIQIGLFSGLTVYAISTINSCSNNLRASVLICLITASICYLASAYYLSKKGKLHSDHSIHKK